jgi:hypothetical protein
MTEQKIRGDLRKLPVPAMCQCVKEPQGRIAGAETAATAGERQPSRDNHVDLSSGRGIHGG